MQVRKHNLIVILLASFSLFWHNAFAAQTDFIAVQNAGAKSRFLASFYQENNQSKLIAGFEIIVEKGWHIYAPDKSGLGVPPTFSFTGSENIDAVNFKAIFPPAITKTEQFGNEKIEYSAYEDRVIIPLELSAANADSPSVLKVEVSYGLCKDICIPVNQKFSLNIAALENDPQVLENINQFYADKKFNSIDTNKASPITKPTSKISLIKALIIAFIGGAILNIMPCVLPVLSIKLLSVINHNNSKLSRIRWAFLSTTLGIIFSFAIFAGAAVFLKSIGNAVGWGFQFQNPYFLLFLLIVLMIFIANLLGMFEFNLGNNLANNLDQKISQAEKKQNIFIPNFFSGILAVLLATPCSAPFVGVAISFALSSDIKEIFLIFAAMSLGLALPYLFLIAFPSSVKLMPKPGAWMIRAKNLMAGFLAATAIWIIYILIDNIGFIAAATAGFLAILVLLFFKIISKINLSKTKIFIAAIIFTALISAIFIVPNRLMYLNKMLEKTQQENWIKFDESKIPGLVEKGKTVVVDITADWCITCKANKLLVLNSSEIKLKLAEPNIVAMRGDLTKPDEKIFSFMKKHNRYGIPLNIVFGPKAPQGILTSELLSKEALLEAIAAASK